MVVPQRGRVELTVGCVRGLRVWEGRGVEIVVVDDGTPGDWGAGRRELEGLGCELVWRAATGVTSAWNAGWRASRGGVVVFLNNDVVVEGAFLGRLVGPLVGEGGGSASFGEVETGEGGGEVGGSRRRGFLSLRDPTTRWSGHPEDARGGEVQVTGVSWREERGVGRVLEGWCLAVRREVLEELGGFDERLRVYFSDTEFQQRVRARWGEGAVVRVEGDGAGGGWPVRHLGHRTAHDARLLPERGRVWREFWRGMANDLRPND